MNQTVQQQCLHCVMTALEDIVQVPSDIDNDSSDDLFGEKLDKDQDPDYEQP